MTYAILIMIIIISVLSLIYVSTYNKLQHFKTRIEVAESTIDDNLRKKYDLLCELNTDIKKVVDNKDYLKEYINLKNQRVTNYDSDRKLVEGFNIIRELKNDYSELSTKEFNKKFNTVKDIDEELSAAKGFYNKYTAELNNVLRKFPTNIIGRNHKFKIKPYFDHKNMQDAVLDDFKL